MRELEQQQCRKEEGRTTDITHNEMHFLIIIHDRELKRGNTQVVGRRIGGLRIWMTDCIHMDVNNKNY